MDESRRTRFLVSPVLFVASLLLGAWFNDPDRARCFVTDLLHWNGNELGNGLVKVAAGLAAGSLVVFVAGYVIGTVTYFVLRGLFRLPSLISRNSENVDSRMLRCLRRLVDVNWRISRTHEVSLPKETLGDIWNRFGLSLPADFQRQELSAGVAFDHGILQKEYVGIHRWLFRRWNAFSIAATSLTGLLLSLVIGHCFLGFEWHWRWYAPILGFDILLCVSGIWAWCDTMKMLEFMASLPKKKRETDPLQIWLRHR